VGIGPFELILILLVAGTSLAVGILQGKTEGVFVGVGSAWMALFAWSVVAAVIGNFLGADTFLEGLWKNAEMLNPFSFEWIMTVLIMGAPGFFFFWLQSAIDKRRQGREG